MARHGDTVWRVCLTALCRHADAEDAFQNSFLKYALADDVQFREEEHRKAWLDSRCFEHVPRYAADGCE